ncbi:MAG: hypothetical protein Q8O74_03380, partial [bacterium]|nr:hypothetical protein [bacterium]
MKILENLTKINRRYIFLMVAVAVIIPLIIPMNLPTLPGKYTIKLYDFIDKIPPQSQPVVIAADYSPSMMPELQPMLESIIRHCFAKKIRVIVLTLDPNGAALSEATLKKIAPEYEARNGE